MTNQDMTDGQLVKVKLSGDDDIYEGVVIRARKKEVEIPDFYGIGQPFITDESCIVYWEPAKKEN